MKTLADDGDKSAARVVRIVEDFDKMLVTVLILINVLHVASSSVATVLAISLMPSNPGLATLISTIVLTLVVFFFSETIPKSIAKENCDAFAKHSSLFIYALVVLLTPISFIFTVFGDFIKKLFKAKDSDPALSGDELSDIVEKVEDEGVITDEESEIIRSAIEFSETTVEDVYTPLEKVVAIDINSKPEEIKEILLEEKYSRIPVYNHDTSHILGILQTKNYLCAMMNSDDDALPDFKNYLVPAMSVRPSAKIETVFERMGKKRNHFAIVTTSRGAMLGVITLEDILEEIVGEIYDEFDTVPQAKGGAK